MTSCSTDNQTGLTIVKKHALRFTKADREDIGQIFERIGGEALIAVGTLLKSASTEQEFRVLVLFDCMLKLLDEPTINSTLAFATKRFRTLQRLFYGALGSERFMESSATSRRLYATAFGNVLERLAQVTPVALLSYRQPYNFDVPNELVAAFEIVPLAPEQVGRFRSYTLVSKSGIEYNTKLAPLAATLGTQFADRFYDSLKAIARAKAKDSALRDFGTTFASFAHYKSQTAKPLSLAALQDPNTVHPLIVDFMEYHFMKMARRESPVQEGTLPSLQKLWSRYKGYWTRLSADNILALPDSDSPFPEGNPSLLNSTSIKHQRTVVQGDGTQSVVTHKLITDVPLHLTDEEATQLLFRRLKADFSSIQTWLSGLLDTFFADGLRGLAISDAIPSVQTDQDLRALFSMKKDAHTVALAAKYIRLHHGGYVDTVTENTILYPNGASRDGPPKSQVAKLLGVPSLREALAMMAFLASTDGRFSEAAMGVCTLLDRNGTRINAVETDAGMMLSVLKARNVKDGWHDIVLDATAADYVRRWISATQPLRDYMRKNDIAGWTNLFIYAGTPLGKPNHFTRSTNLNSPFRKLALEHKNVLGAAAEIVSIPRIRSTRGVLVFLEKMDLSAMARELGNTEITSLRHYLPDSLWEYFAVRWLRIFQNLMIVEATRDTPYMQRALSFQSSVEVDAFLRNHALEPLMPPSDEVGLSPSKSDISEIMVAASPGLFTVLLSISAAATRAETDGRVITPQALYWMEFSNRLSAHILSDDFHDRGIKRMMSEAVKNMNEIDFMEVVCA